MATTLKPADQCPKLQALAHACNSGACNPAGLINSLPEAVREISPFEVKTHPAVKCIIGQISYLLGQSTGPTVEALEECQAWLK